MLEVVNSGSNGDDLDRGNDDVIINFIGSADALLRLLPPIRMHCSMAGELLSLCEEQVGCLSLSKAHPLTTVYIGIIEESSGKTTVEGMYSPCTIF